MPYQPPPNIQNILDNLPNSPGVYQMLDRHNEIIYIGKAKNLRSRVRSYFQPANVENKVQRIRERVTDIQIIVLESELKALTVEAQLIRQHKPRYNVIWKDDKRYPYIIVRTHDAFPKVELTRRVERNDGNRYFGPYASGWVIRNMLDALRKAFPFLTCDREITGQDARACLYYDIKLCGAPCIGAQTQEEYRQSITGLMRVLEGKSDAVLAEMQAKMMAAADALEFEKAMVLRDRIHTIERVIGQQYRIAKVDADQDVIALAHEEGQALVQLFVIRSGHLVASESFPLENVTDEAPGELISSFLTQYYESAAEVPSEILLPTELATVEAQVIEQWLRNKRSGRKVVLKAPQRGENAALIKQASETAVEQLGLLKAQQAKDTVKQETALAEIQAALNLPHVPNRIECYDVSTLQGTATVGSRVVFVQGVPYKNEYRRFNIRSIPHEGSDDYYSMREMLTRRFQRYVEALNDQEEIPPGQEDRHQTWRLLPDLLIVDGGKGQLGIAIDVLKSFGLSEHVPVVGLAKQLEELFTPDSPRSIRLPRTSEGLYLLQRIRDEAHRFAISSNRRQREKKGIASRLESVQGIGPAKRKALLMAFHNDINSIRIASIEDLTRVKGITEELAHRIKSALNA